MIEDFATVSIIISLSSERILLTRATTSKSSSAGIGGGWSSSPHCRLIDNLDPPAAPLDNSGAAGDVVVLIIDVSMEVSRALVYPIPILV